MVMRKRHLRKYQRPLGMLFCLFLIAIAACGAEQSLQSTIEPDSINDINGNISKVDPFEIIEIITNSWHASTHAQTFVLDPEGNNNQCAQCHSPIEWMPSMDDIPESCLTCKFEIKDPPSFVAESNWQSIPCNVCHEVDKNDNVLPEFSWLEIAPIGQYASVGSSTELCEKCHRSVEIPNHILVQIDGAHQDYSCTDCHDAHSNQVSCSSESCHPSTDDSWSQSPGHDENHQLVSCEACHDGSGQEIGIENDTDNWTTFVTDPFGESVIPFTSHNIVLNAMCDRCHFSDNPFGLSETVEQDLIQIGD